MVENGFYEMKKHGYPKKGKRVILTVTEIDQEVDAKSAMGSVRNYVTVGEYLDPGWRYLSEEEMVYIDDDIDKNEEDDGSVYFAAIRGWKETDPMPLTNDIISRITCGNS